MKRTKSMRILVLVLAVVMSVTFLSACTKTPVNTNTQNTPAASASASVDQSKAPITLDWYINFNWFVGTWGEDQTSQYVTKKTGVSLNVQVPAGDANAKLNVMIASGKLPDVLTLGWYEEGVKKMIEGGLVEPLDGLSQQYDPEFIKNADPGKTSWYTQPDGHFYGYPNASSSLTDFAKYKDLKPSNQTFLVRKDMYEALGKPDMRTPDGFLKALKDAKAKYPTVNGQSLIPFGTTEFGPTGNSALEGYLQNFLAVPYEKDGKLYDRRSDPEYLKWLKTLRTANSSGLLSKDIFVDKRPQMEEKIAQGRYFSMLYQRSDLGTPEQTLFNKDKNSVYIAVDGPADTALDAPKLSGDAISGWTLTMISKSCKDKARAIKFLTYMISEEGQKDMYLGEKGVSYDTIGGKDQYKPEVLQMLQSDRPAFDKKYGASFKWWMLMDTNMMLNWAPPSVEPTKQMEDWTKGKTANFSQFDNINPPADSPEGVSNTKITDLWGTTLPKLLTAKSDAAFDTLFNDFMTKTKALGFDKLVAYQQVKVDANKKKLGIQ